VPVYLNAAVFTANAPGTYGNLGRDFCMDRAKFSLTPLSRIFGTHKAIRLEVCGEALALNSAGALGSLSLL